MESSLAGCAYGAWTFQPEEHGFRAFFANFATLGLSYGFACTATSAGTPWRRQVLEPTRKFSRLLPFLDFGLVFAPFVFPILAMRYFLAGPRDGAEARGMRIGYLQARVSRWLEVSVPSGERMATSPELRHRPDLIWEIYGPLRPLIRRA